MVNRVGQQFGNYRLIRLLGQGGFAQVYLGEHLYLQTQAAIKILHMRLAHADLKDFLAEARTIAHLSHSHIIQVLDFGLEGSIPYLVMQYAPSGSLRQRHPLHTPIPLHTILTYLQPIASALQYVHDQHLVHRDVKPENMLLGKQDELLLSDFGVAVVTHSAGQALHHESGGTVAYMAPEQINGFASPASDQYALGIVVYEWLCGRRPFSGSIEEVIQQHLHTPPTDLHIHLPAVTPTVAQTVLRALAKDPAQRFPCIADFAAAITCQPSEAYTLSSFTPLATSTSDAMEQISSATPTTPPASMTSLRMLPHRRNLFFTGREDVLHTLYSRFHEDKAGFEFRPQAICGLGGIGKTQTAIEFTYRYHADYTAIFWVRADSYETLCSDYIQMAHLLNLHAQDKESATSVQNQQHLIEAVKQWLEERSSWLLIFDNAEDLALVHDFIPLSCTGHILLTTRIQATTSVATPLDLEKLEPTNAALFLLRRTGFIQRDAPSVDTASADYIEAHDIALAMDGLPLALDQAGAYIEETGCSLFDYFDRYRRQRSTLLDMRGNTPLEHPESVATTWLLSFQKVAQMNPLAAELLHFCAFLHPDEIPEELLTTRAVTPGQLLAQDLPVLDTAIATLRKFSLVRRNTQSKSLTMHRLVQAIIKDGMKEQAQRLWAERVICAVSRIFPSGDEVTSWPACQRLLPQVYVCLSLIEQWQLAFPEAARLLDQAGLYLLEQAQYTQARYLLHKALAIREQVQGAEHLDVAETLNYLAGTYLHQGMYAQAEALFTRILATRELLQGLDHPDVAIELNNLALLYNRQGKYTLAEPLFQRALHIWEQSQGMEHPNVARTLNNLALLYQEQHKFSQAETLYLQALAIWERIHGTTHPDVAISLNNLAKLYHLTGKYAQAEPLFQRVLEIRESTLGSEHPAVAHSLTYLANLYLQQWKYAEAELLFKHALHIRKHTLGPEHPDVAHSLCNLGRLYARQGKFALAEPLFQEAVTLYEQALGPDHIHVALALKDYALLLCAMRRKDEAIPLMRRILAIRRTQSQQQVAVTN